MMDKFQSPDGDFVYSDELCQFVQTWSGKRFNPLTGISSILTGFPKRLKRIPKKVSIP